MSETKTETTMRRLLWLTRQETALSAAFGVMEYPTEALTDEEAALTQEARRTLLQLYNRTSRQRVAVSGDLMAEAVAEAKAAK